MFTLEDLAPPVIDSFTGKSVANEDAELLDVTLSWELSGGEPTTLSIEPDVGDVTNEESVTTTVTAGETITFTLTAKNLLGEDSATFEVTAQTPTPEMPENPDVTPITGKETVTGSVDETDALLSDYFEEAVGFYADAYELEPLNEGETVFVNLTGTGDEGAEFDSYLYVIETVGDESEVIGDVDGLPGDLERYLIEAVADATYTILVSSYEPEDAGGYILETNGAPLINSFIGNPFIVDEGDTTTLEWSVAESTQSVEIDGGIGDVTTQDSANTSTITEDTTFTLSATNRFGTNEAEAQIVLRAGRGTLQIDSSDSVEIIGPDSFEENSTVSVTLADLSADESIAIIPVHATQNLDYDRLSYQIEIDNVTPTYQAPPLATQAVNPFAERLVSLQQDHFVHLQEELEFLTELNEAGYPRADELKLQGFEDNCAAPYVVNEKTCDFYVTGELRDTTLVYDSANAYWFLDDEYADEFTAEELADQARRFEDELLPVIEDNFGTFQDLDGNGKIFIVLSSLDFFGYVTSQDFVLNGTGELESPVSNEGDIFYAAVPSDFEAEEEEGFSGISKEDFLDIWLPSTLVHELKHLVALGIRFTQFENDSFIGFEEAWFEEGSAVIAEELSPYPSALSGYAQAASSFGLSAPQEVRIVGEVDNTFSWYGWNFLHLWKIAEEVGPAAFLKPWTAGPEVGIENIEKNLGDTFENFPDTMLTWAATLMFDDTELSLLNNYDYQYDKLNLRDAQEDEDDDVFWETLSYEPLEPGVGATRSAAYYVGQGTGEDVTISLSSLDAEPYFMVVRFNGELPY